MLTRRAFLFALSAGCLGLYSWRLEPQWLEIVFRSLPIRGLPSSLHGRTLVQMSDLHVGCEVPDEYTKKVFEQVSALHPDIVTATGDLISWHPDVFGQITSVFKDFPRGRLATLAILGNHDYGPGWSNASIADRVAKIAATLGITVLRNQIHEVEGLRIVGLDDLWANRFDRFTVSKLVKNAAPAAVLSHNPDTVDLPVWGGYKGWILSGHTHGGQCKPPFLPPPLLPVDNRRYTSGEFDLSGGRRLYISRGVGHLIPVRFNVRPEVTVFTMCQDLS